MSRHKVAQTSPLSLIYLKQKEYEKCIEKATLVLKEDPDNLKALGRRGLAHSMDGSHDLAKKDLAKAHKIDPNDKFVAKAMKANKAKIRAYKDKQKKLYGNMFGGGGGKGKGKD